jgi:hypothetical protein
MIFEAPSPSPPSLSLSLSLSLFIKYFSYQGSQCLHIHPVPLEQFQSESKVLKDLFVEEEDLQNRLCKNLKAKLFK